MSAPTDNVTAVPVTAAVPVLTAGQTASEQLASWPANEASGLPGFQLTVPENWTARVLPGLLGVVGPLLKELETNGFLPTVTVTGDSVEPGMQAADILAVSVSSILSSGVGAVLSPREEPTMVCPLEGPGFRHLDSMRSARLHAKVGDHSTEHVVTVAVVATSQTRWHAFVVTSAWSPSTSPHDPGLVLGRIHSSFQLTV